MYEYREIGKQDAEQLLKFLCDLDNEAEWMLYRPGERSRTVHDLRGHLNSLRSNSGIYVAISPGRGIVSYLALYGGRMERNYHVASLSCGTLKEHQGKGLATALFELGSICAYYSGIKRIELTVVRENTRAMNLYRRWGFDYEGYKNASYQDDKGEFHCEYLMSYLMGIQQESRT